VERAILFMVGQGIKWILLKRILGQRIVTITVS